ncbi:hypothetical protein [Sanyastnella coralliicola]|uniref:hypothetical protein n=1 Tax=Sanyastnella coralliicola TaxID=3069118 RepID=UPI0027BA5A0B|nr:hypothetical protein [Longitalea sp. SCSIO 12813]
MKEKNNIDELFREQLAGQQASFNQAHWSQMEQMLDARKGRGRWWFFAVPLVLLLLTSVGIAHQRLASTEGQTIDMPVHFTHASTNNGEHLGFAENRMASIYNSQSSIDRAEGRNGEMAKGVDTANGLNGEMAERAKGLNGERAKGVDPGNGLNGEMAERAKGLNGEMAKGVDSASGPSGEMVSGPTGDMADGTDALGGKSGAEITRGGGPELRPGASGEAGSGGLGATDPTDDSSGADVGADGSSLGQDGNDDSDGNDALGGETPFNPFHDPAYDEVPRPSMFLPETRWFVLNPEYTRKFHGNQRDLPNYRPNIIELRPHIGLASPFGKKQIQSENTSTASLTDERATTFGLGISYLMKGWDFSSGFQIHRFENELTTVQGGDTLEYFEYFEEQIVDSITIEIIEQIDSTFNENQEEWIVDTTYIEIADTAFTFIEDSVLVTEIERGEERKFKQQRSVVEIPLMVGKRFQWKRWELGVRVGPSFMLQTTVDGVVLSDGRFVDRSAAAQTLSISIRSDVHIAYSLSERLGVYTGFSTRFGVTPTLQSDIYEERLNSYGFVAGLQIRLH